MKLIESFKTSPISNENKVKVESVLLEGKEVNCLGVYTFPISRPDETNLNERVYSSKLWENVIKKKMAENSYGLMDHPVDEGSVKDSWCVWKNIRFSEDKKLILADAYLFGDNGRHVQEALDAGGNVGLSTVGYGDFKEDKKTIDESSYELDRVADFVLNPSYQVFGTAEDAKTEEVLTEAKAKVCENCGITILPEIAAGEKCPGCENIWNVKAKVATKAEEIAMDSKVKSFQERTFETQIKSYMKQAEAMELVTDKIDQYNEIISYLDDPSELKEEVSSRLNELKEEFSNLAIEGTKVGELTEAKQTLEEKVTEASAKLEATVKELEDLSEKYNVASKMLDNTKYYANKMKDLYRTQKAASNGMATATEYNESLKYIEDLEKQNAEARIVNRDLQKENADLVEKMKIIDFKEQNLKDIVLKAEADEAAVLEAKKIEDDENAVKAEVQRKVESIDISNSSEVEEYYEDLYTVNRDVKIIKEDILKCSTVFEAQNTYLRLKDLFEESSFDTRRDLKTNLTEEYSFNKEAKFVIEEGVTPKKLNLRDTWI